MKITIHTAKLLTNLQNHFYCENCENVYKFKKNLLKHNCNPLVTKVIYSKTKHLPTSTVSKCIFYGTTKYSYISIRWIEYMRQHLRWNHIHTAVCGHGGERVIPINRKTLKLDFGNETSYEDIEYLEIDGYDPETEYAFEFNGCNIKNHPCENHITEDERKLLIKRIIALTNLCFKEKETLSPRLAVELGYDKTNKYMIQIINEELIKAHGFKVF